MLCFCAHWHELDALVGHSFPRCAAAICNDTSLTSSAQSEAQVVLRGENASLRRAGARAEPRRGCSGLAGAPVMHGDGAAAERRSRDQLEPSRAGQPALVEGWAVAGDPGVDEEIVLV